MAILATTGLPFVDEHEADGDVAATYDEIKREMQMPIVPNMVKGLAGAPNMLALQWEMVRAFFGHMTLPQSLIAMISYTIATKSDCTYCSVNNELTCLTLGIDEDTLNRLVNDLDSVSPQRIQAIIEFALKVAKYPQSLELADYDALRNQGISDAEILEIVTAAAMAVFTDIMADALKIDVEEMTTAALAQLK